MLRRVARAVRPSLLIENALFNLKFCFTNVLRQRILAEPILILDQNIHQLIVRHPDHSRELVAVGRAS